MTRLSRLAAGGRREPLCPIRVEVVDAADELPTISSDRPDGGHYVSAWVVVRRDGVPRGTLEVGFGPDGVVDPAELADRIASLPAPVARETPVAPDTLPSISVVIPTNLARPGCLLPTLASLSRTTYPDVEIIVVDNRPDGGGDPLPDILRSYPQVRWVHQPVKGCDSARNAGLAAARGEIVAFTDDDVQVDPMWVPALGRHFAAHPDEDAVGGLILPLELETTAQLWFERYYGGFGAERQYEPMSFASTVSADGRREPWQVVATNCRSEVVRTFPVYGAGVIGVGANMAFRTEAIKAIGGFDTALGIGTPSRGGGDIAAFMSILWRGGRAGFEPAATVFHQHRRAAADLRRQLHSYGVGYTAILLSLAVRDHGHLGGIARQLPTAIERSLRRGRGPSHRPQDSRDGVVARAYPRHLRMLELVGNLQGPASYVASARRARRWAG